MPQIEILSNLSLLIVLSVLSGYLNRLTCQRKKLCELSQGVLFGLILLLSMSMAFTIDGANFDGRTIIISLCSYYFGVLSGIIVSLLAVIFRIYLGGPYTIFGIVTVLISFLVGLIFYLIKEYKRKIPENFYDVLLISLITHLSIALLFLKFHLLPMDLMLSKTGLFIFLIYIFASLIFGYILYDQKQNFILQKELRDSNILLDKIFNNPLFLIAILDKNFNFIRVNKAFADAENLTPDQFIGRNYFDFYQSDFKSDFEKVIETKKPIQFASRPYFHRNPKVSLVTYWDWSLTPILDKNGEIEFLVLSLIETTEKVELEKVRDRLVDLINNSINFIGIADANGKPVFLNDAGMKMLEIKNDVSLEYSSLLEAHPDWTRKILSEIAIPEAIKNGKWIGETALLSKTGKIIPVIQTIVVHKDELGNIKFMTTIATDISKIKELENLIVKGENELRLMKKAVEESEISIFITDIEGKIIYVNKKFEQTTGYIKEEAIGKKPNILKSGYHPLEFYKNLWNTILSGNSFVSEFLNKRKNGELYWERITIVPLKDKENKIINFVSFGEDVTENKRMLEELIFAKAKAEEANRIKSQFLSAMSHEIRTPLNAILGYADLIIEYFYQYTTPEVNRWFEALKSNSSRLLETIKTILDYHKIEAGEYQPLIEKFSLTQTIKEVVNQLLSLAMKKNVEVKISLPEEDIQINSDGYAINTILINLINNAIKFTNEGYVEILLEKLDNKVKLYVKDTGIGMSEEYQKFLFEAFSQELMGYKREYEGTGLGLALCKKFIDSLNGEIEVYSKKGKGSTFIVTLPINFKK